MYFLSLCDVYIKLRGLTLSWQPKLAGMFSITYSHKNKNKKKKRFMSSYSICKQDKFI